MVYPPDSHASRAGVNMHCSPAGLNADEAILSYEVKFSPDFPWTKGGK